MSNGSELKSPGAAALRAAGFVPLPRLWVKREDMDAIRAIAESYADQVNAIRASATQGEKGKLWQIEQAWREVCRLPKTPLPPVQWIRPTDD
jgi:hypothetical protein